MIWLAALLLLSGIAMLGWRTRGGRFRNGPASPRRRRQLALAGGGAIVASGLTVCAAGGWFGLIAWIGLMPVAAGATMLVLAYRPAAR